MKSLVVESSDELRVTGAAFVTWTNGWKALDALAVGDLLRPQHCRLSGYNLTFYLFPLLMCSLFGLETLFLFLVKNIFQIDTYFLILKQMKPLSFYSVSK